VLSYALRRLVLAGASVAVGPVALPEQWRVHPEDRLAADLAMQPRVRRAYYRYQ